MDALGWIAERLALFLSIQAQDFIEELWAKKRNRLQFFRLKPIFRGLSKIAG
jgi:hypothetical protein